MYILKYSTIQLNFNPIPRSDPVFHIGSVGKKSFGFQSPVSHRRGSIQMSLIKGTKPESRYAILRHEMELF